MELFERIKAFLAALDISERKMATALGLDQSQFNRYLTGKSQKNLWEYLPKILELHPRLNRNWLYFEEGQMFGEAPPQQEETSVLRQRIIDLEGQVRALTGQAEAVRELVDSKRGELAKAEKIIALYERREAGPQTLAVSGDVAPTVPISISAE